MRYDSVNGVFKNLAGISNRKLIKIIYTTKIKLTHAAINLKSKV